MRNQTKRVFTHKSKVFLTILCMLGLVFSWSCSCKNRVSNPDDTPTDGGTNFIPPGTFSISEATDNVKASIVKSSTTSISDIKIGFVSANNYAYSLTYTVEDSETDETKKITADDFQVANNVLTAKDSVATKMKQVDSSTAPGEKTITINFTFTADDKTLNNYTQTLSVNVTLTHAQEIIAGDTEIQFVVDALKAAQIVLNDENSDNDVLFQYASYDSTGKYYIYKNTASDSVFSYDMSKKVNTFITRLKRSDAFVKYMTDATFNNDIASVDGDDKSITFSLTFVMKDAYELADNKINIKVTSVLDGTKWVIPSNNKD